MEVNVKNEKQVTELPFPKLMISENAIIVLFVEPKIGACISPTHMIETYGKEYTGWSMENFTDFKGEITIKQ